MGCKWNQKEKGNIWVPLSSLNHHHWILSLHFLRNLSIVMKLFHLLFRTILWERAGWRLMNGQSHPVNAIPFMCLLMESASTWFSDISPSPRNLLCPFVSHWNILWSRAQGAAEEAPEGCFGVEGPGKLPSMSFPGLVVLEIPAKTTTTTKEREMH